MAMRLVQFTLPVERVQLTLDRLVSGGKLTEAVALRGIGANTICAATGLELDVMLLVGALAEEGQPGLLSVESC